MLDALGNVDLSGSIFTLFCFILVEYAYLHYSNVQHVLNCKVKIIF